MDPGFVYSTQQIETLGSESEAALTPLIDAVKKGDADLGNAEAVTKALADVMGAWQDGPAAIVINAVVEHILSGEKVDPNELVRWVRYHSDKPDRVVECLKVNPPPGVSVLAVLSEAGSQKMVYLADWATVQREVVLKRLMSDAEKLMPREMLPHPLSMVHPNIIETHLLPNSSGEDFLIEKRLAEVLNDDWKTTGIVEAANLLHDIASALAFLGNKGLVHGDVKPDNIGYEDRRYILLDFGICRPESEFGNEATATGSLRTRAPELLAGEGKHTGASDVWALAATVFNACIGRFPLYEMDEAPPRSSHPEERERCEKALAARIPDWDKWVIPGFAEIENEGLRAILEAALKLDPERRPSAEDLVDRCRQDLAAFVRWGEGANGLSATETLRQMSQYLAGPEELKLMPLRRQRELTREIEEIAEARGLSADEEKIAKSLISNVTEA